MPDDIRIQPAGGTWVVRAGGAVLGESDRALMVTDGALPFVIYFPREDIATEFLDPSETRRSHPVLGEATFFSIAAEAGILPDAVWSYEAPASGVGALRDHLAFHATDQVAIEQV